MYVNQESTDWLESSRESPEQRSRKTAYCHKEEEEERKRKERRRKGRGNNAPSGRFVYILEIHRDEESEEATLAIQLNERP